MDEVIHYVAYASQPYVTFLCTGEEHYVWVSKNPALPEGVWQLKEGLYTFDKNSVTCPACLRELTAEMGPS